MSPTCITRRNTSRATGTTFPKRAGGPISNPRGNRPCLQNNVVNGELVVPPFGYFAMGDNRTSRSTAGTGVRAAGQHHWQAADRLLVLRRANRATGGPVLGLRHLLDIGAHFFSKTRWNPHVHVDSWLPQQILKNRSRPARGTPSRIGSATARAWIRGRMGVDHF